MNSMSICFPSSCLFSAMGEEIATNCGLLICSIARSLSLKLTGTGRLQLRPVCRKCQEEGRHRGGSVKFEDVQPLFKLIGTCLMV